MGRRDIGCAISVYSQLRRFSASGMPPPRGVSLQHMQLKLRGSSCSDIMTKKKSKIFANDYVVVVARCP